MVFRDRYGPWAIVAGASEGIGRSIAHKLAEQGVSCLLIALEGPLEDVAEEIRRDWGVECATARIDLSTEDAFARIVEVAGDREIGLYVANAGGDSLASRYLDHDIAGWLALTRVNVLTTMQACHHFGLRMRERRRGGLLIVNSYSCYGGGSFLVTYNACKGFLLNFSEGLWAELRPHGVDVLTVALGIVDTPNLRRILARTGMPVPADIASTDEIASFALARLADGPVQNWGLAEDESSDFGTSAAARRARVLELNAFSEQIYGETS